MTIPWIGQPDRSINKKTQKILNLFYFYYVSLCKEPETLRLGAIDDFIKDLPLPSLSVSHRDMMEGAISMEEVMPAIKQQEKHLVPYCLEKGQ